MSSKQIGYDAENKVAKYLRSEGYSIVGQNWKNRFCEIDIIAKRHNILYFVEVKFRGSEKWGSGLEYITGNKIAQMHYAAEHWVSAHRYNGDYVLSAAEVTRDGSINFIA